MAKRSQKRPVRYEKDQSGCMWGLMSMFDFRNGRSTQKLIADRRRSRHANGNRKNKLDRSTINEDDQDGEESRSAAANAGKPSVKKLIEEEMISEQDPKKETSNVEIEVENSDAEQGTNVKKTHKRMKRNRKKSCDSILDLDASANSKSEQPCQTSEFELISTLDVDSILEEFCHQIQGKSKDNAKQDLSGELCIQSNLKDPDFEEKLKETIKLLVSQKLLNGKHFAEGEDLNSNKELMDALQALGSEKELLVKHLQDPNSPLVKSIRCFPDEQSCKDDDAKSLAESKVMDVQLENPAQCDEPVDRKQRNFLRRKGKSHRKSLSNEENTSQASNRIVILKPGPTGLQNQETASSIGLSPESRYIIRSKLPNERNGSHFFFAEIKRKLRNAMGKEHHRFSTDGSPEYQNVGNRDRGFRDNMGINSPTKDHFFMEKIARPSSFKKGDKTTKLKGDELNAEQRAVDSPKKSASNLYSEAKKHLSEMLTNGEDNLNSSSGRSKTLGRILALPEYNFSPLGSPVRNNWDESFVTAKMRLLDSEQGLKVNENTSSVKEDNQVNHLEEITEGSVAQPCISDGNASDKEASDLDSNILDEQIQVIGVEEITSCTGDGMISEDDLDIIKTNEIAIVEESSVLDAPCEPSSLSGGKDEDKSGRESDSEIYCEQRDPKCIEQDLPEENQLPTSPVASSSDSPILKKVEDHEAAIDTLERPSPVSVLEPLFAEDDISPASTIPNLGEIRIQPLQIKFEENNFLTADQNNQVKNPTGDKESVYKYVKAVLKVSGLNWDEICKKLLTTDHLINPSLCDEVEFYPSKLCCEQNLLFDCVNEVLMEVCGHYFGCSPWVSFAKPYIRPVPNKETVINEVWEGVLWYLDPLPVPPTLDQTVRKDMAKSGTWMDLRNDTDVFGIKMGEYILEDLMEDTILSYVNGSLEMESPDLPAEELKERKSGIDSDSVQFEVSVESDAKEEQLILVN